MLASLMLYLSAFASILVAVLVSRFVRHMMTLRKVKKALEKFPSRKRHWLLGNLTDLPDSFGKDFIKYYRDCCKENPRADSFLMTTFWGGWLRVWHPDTVKAILKTSEPKYTYYGTYQCGKDWLGDCLLLSSGAKWARNRKLLTPSFHFGALKQFVHIKNACSQILLDKLLHLKAKGESVEMFRNFIYITSDVLLRCGFSHESNVQQDGYVQPYAEAVRNLSALWVERTLRPWLIYDWIYRLTSNGRKWRENVKIVHDFTRNVIAEKKGKTEKNQTKDFLDILLAARDEDGNGLSDVEIQNEVDVFMFAGHETSSSALAWTCYSLASHPDEQTKCQQEVDELLRGRNSDEITHEDLNRLPYLTMCIKEAMRLYSVVPVIEREVSKPLSIDGVELPEHTMITIMIMCMNLSEEVWDEPLKYKPERFLPENLEGMDPFSFVPFSAGPRNCIGQHFAMNELKIVLARLLRRLTFKPDEEKLPQPLVSIVMKSENGVHLYIEERNLTPAN